MTSSTYAVPTLAPEPQAPERTVYLVASGDLRESANVAGWPTQVELERVLTDAFAANGWKVVRANDVDPETGHGFISSQRMGLEVFATIRPTRRSSSRRPCGSTATTCWPGCARTAAPCSRPPTSRATGRGSSGCSASTRA